MQIQILFGDTNTDSLCKCTISINNVLCFYNAAKEDNVEGEKYKKALMGSRGNEASRN